MAYKPMFGSRHRERLWSQEEFKSHQAARGRYPICVHCDLPVTPGQDWDEAHVVVPKCFGGKSKGIAHRRCNQLDNHLVVTPAAAKANEVRKRHLGIKGPGLGPKPMRCGRRTDQTKTFNNGVQRRRTLAEKHRDFLARRYPFTTETEAGHEA